ncbi:hypothetical protein LINPERPRIM_LOCUS26867 [Linum perenne]
MFTSSNSQPATIMFVAVAVLLAAVPASSSWFWPWSPPQYDVHIVNELSGNKQLYAHCRCTHDSQPKTYIDAGAQYELSFKPHFLKLTLIDRFGLKKKTRSVLPL